MRKIFLPLFLFTFHVLFAQRLQDYENQRAELSFHGQVFKQWSRWDSVQGRIYTYNLTRVKSIYRIPAGKAIHDSVILITEGGSMDQISQSASHNLSLKPGAEGHFVFEKFPRLFYLRDFPGVEVMDVTGEAQDVFFPEVADLINHFTTNEGTNKRKEKLDFNPKTVSAGTNTVLTVTGSDFGTSRGKGGVYFRSAEDGGFSFINFTDASDYISWRDNEIKVRLSSKILSDPSGSTPGSGTFIIRTNAGETFTTAEALTINYAIRNDALPGSSLKSIAHLVSGNMHRNMQIQLSEEVAGNPDFIQVIEKAVNTWRCRYGINFQLKKNQDGRLVPGPAHSGFDNICLVSFTDKLSSSVLARTIHYNTKCINNRTGSDMIISREFDIEVNKDVSWDTDITGKSIQPGKEDFYAVLLHELGHAAGLEHVNAKDDIMYYQVSPSPRKNLESTKAGGQSCVASAVPFLHNVVFNVLPECSSAAALSKGKCIETLARHVESDLEIFPNPSTDEVILFFRTTAQNPVLTICDPSGRLLSRQDLRNAFISGNELSLSTTFLKPGLYLFVLEGNEKKMFKKFLKI